MTIKHSVRKLVYVVVGLILLYALFDHGMSFFIHARREVLVPDLRGKSLEEADRLLKSGKLDLRVDGAEFDQSLPRGAVVRQNPEAGLAVRQGKTVRVTVSQGGEAVVVPSLVGQSIRSAEISIRSTGFSLGEVSSRYSVVYKKDTVVAQDPAAGSPAEKEALVNLVVSSGRPPASMRLMPDFTGRHVEEVRAWAGKNGIGLDVRSSSASAESGPDTVINQDPAPDMDITAASSVSVTVGS